MSFYDEIKKELEENPQAKAEFDELEVPTFKEFWDENEHMLRKPEHKQKKKKRPRSLPQILSVAASILLFVGLSLGLYFGLKPDSPVYRYEDKDITMKDDENDLLHNSGLYLPDLLIIDQKIVMVGEHNESHEAVYFIIKGVYDNGEQYREIQLTIILQKKYELIDNEEKYNTENIEEISGYDVSVYDNGEDDPFYRYKLGFKVGEIRYYIDYDTIEKNDYVDFLTEFLK